MLYTYRSFIYRRHAQAFLVKTVQSVFRITLKMNTTVIVFLVTREATAKQVSLGLIHRISNREKRLFV